MAIYGRYVNIKQVCSAIYFNAGVIISSIIFIFADPKDLQLGKVFSTIALLGYIFNFSILYSNYALEAIYKIMVFNKRIDQIVNAAQEFSDKKHNGFKKVASQEPILRFKAASIAWGSGTVLSDISCDFEGPQKVAVIGRVGCGKSTLLHAIMRESLTHTGVLECSDRVSFAEQNPLIISGTIRSNILYGSFFDKNYYNDVI
jgi:ATP-binding cassette, subfamily C (CFTR/MRP), member 1